MLAQHAYKYAAMGLTSVKNMQPKSPQYKRDKHTGHALQPGVAAHGGSHQVRLRKGRKREMTTLGEGGEGEAPELGRGRLTGTASGGAVR